MDRQALIQKYLSTAILINKHISKLKKSNFSMSELNQAQVEMLYVLSLPERMTMGRIAQVTNTTSGAVTQLIDGLIKLGYLQKVRDEEDRRITYLEFTQRGRDKFSRLQSEHLAYWQRLLSDVDNSSLSQLIEVQNSIVKKIL
jgi:DNA-binding MarR family transcriptional regulator